MTQYDKSTEEFIKAVAPLSEEEKKKKIQALTRRGFSLAALATSRRPSSLATRSAARALTGEALQELFTKEGGLPADKIYTYLNQKYRDSWHDWEPETIWKTLKEDEGIDATPEVKNLIQAFQVIVNTNFAHESWQVFENVGHAINQNIVDFGEVQPLEVNEICYAISIINKIRPKKREEDRIWDKLPENVRPDHGFEKEIWAYVAASAKNAGLVFLPPELFGGSGSPQNILDNDLGNDFDLKLTVSRLWPNPPSKNDPLEVQIQLGRLKEIKEYVEDNHG